jgi:hypothetical protein
LKVFLGGSKTLEAYEGFDYICVNIMKISVANQIYNYFSWGPNMSW